MDLYVSYTCNVAQGLPFPKLKSLLVEKSWLKILEGEFEKPYMERLHQFLSQEAAANIPIYPPPPKLFNVFNSCPFDKVKVVIIGQVCEFSMYGCKHDFHDSLLDVTCVAMVAS